MSVNSCSKLVRRMAPLCFVTTCGRNVMQSMKCVQERIESDLIIQSRNEVHGKNKEGLYTLPRCQDPLDTSDPNEPVECHRCYY